MASKVETLESIRERQNDEIEVLKSLFVEERSLELWQHVADDGLKYPEIKIHLTPQQTQSMYGSTEIHAEIDLIVKLSRFYPNDVPELSLDNSKGLSNVQVSELQNSLDIEANKLKGEVMIYDLTQFIQNFLYDNNKPGPKSFYEEMMQNRQLQEEKFATEQKKKEYYLKKKKEKEQHLIDEEIHKRQEVLRDEMKKKKDGPGRDSPILKLGKHESSMSPKTFHSNNPDTEIENIPKRSHTSILNFKAKNDLRICKGKCLSHNSRGSTVYSGMDTETGELVVISEWTLKLNEMKPQPDSADEEATKYLKQISNLEQELMSLVRLNHPNLVHYLAMKYFCELGRLTVYILQEYVPGCTLDFHYKNNVPVSVDVLQFYASQLLSAFTYLHDKAVTHRDVRVTSIFLDNDGKIRLADYSLEKRLTDLYDLAEEANQSVHFSKKPSRLQFLGKSAKKTDVYQLGIILLSLSVGEPIVDNEFDIPEHLPKDFQDFLRKSLMKDERLRWSTSQLQEHEFIKPSIPRKIANKMDIKMKDKDPGNKSDSENEMTSYIHPGGWEISGQSRIVSEFEVMEKIGKGGFGDVIKVKNRLDGRWYAIKRILLTPNSKQLNKKITREVKLLSRLNHENVVRYYNSWIETSVDSNSKSSSTQSFISSSSSKPVEKSDKNKNSLGMIDDIENLAPPIAEASVDWGSSADVKYPTNSNDSSSSSEDDNSYDDVFGRSFMALERNYDDSDDVVFGDGGDESNDVNEKENSKEITPSDVCHQPTLVQFLYIQMEYCEKSTLRHCIDAGLFQDMDRVWRLFREIIEGLIHIHEQGMIHRDLKPVNIFLDSNDHVKIGDFGLATTDIIAKQQQTSFIDTVMLSLSQHDASIGTSKSGSHGDIQLTGKVGTALYVSPEMMNSEKSKTNYSQKVDIYSLGIMFFEMTYKPMLTGMERVRTITNMRKPSIEFPEDFDELEMPNQAYILRLLLNHDPEKRPTTQELLQSDYLPPPLMEEAELNEMIRSSISNTQSKSYKRMINAMFNQEKSPVFDFMYDNELIHKGAVTEKTQLAYEYVYSSMERVFQKHGAVKFDSPLLVPKCDFYDQNDTYSCFMDKSGGLVGLPYDLRIPYARCVIKNGITNLKRYSIARVYRAKRLFGQHPVELTEAAFDIVTDANSLIPDAEVLHVLHDISNEIPAFNDLNVSLRINHASLLKAVFLHCGIPEDIHQHVYKILADAKPGKDKREQNEAKLLNLNISAQSVESLLNFCDTEAPFGKVASMLRCITKGKGQAGSLAKKGLHEMEAILSHANCLGVNYQSLLSLGLVSNIPYSGFLFQVVVVVQKKKRKVFEVLAEGGRYDSLLTSFHSSAHPVQKPTQTAVGISIAMDRIVSTVLDYKYPDSKDDPIPTIVDVLICSVGHRHMAKDALSVAKDLWAAGVSTDILYDSSLGLEEVHESCRKAKISQLVILKDSESGTVRIRTIERDRVDEKKKLLSECVDHIQQKVFSKKRDPNDTVSNVKPVAVYSSQPLQENSANLKINSSIVLVEGVRISNMNKKRLESLMYAKVSSLLQTLSIKSQVEVVSVDLDVKVLRTIAAYVEFETDEAAFDAAIAPVFEKHQKYRKYLTKIFDYLHDIWDEKNNAIIVLYGQKDDSVKLLA